MSTSSIHSIIHDIARFGIEARQLKSLLRRHWERPMADEQRRLVVLRARLTELLVTRAHARGRLHQRSRPPSAPGSWTAEAHAAVVAARVLSRYAAPAVAAPTVTGATDAPAERTLEIPR